MYTDVTEPTRELTKKEKRLALEFARKVHKYYGQFGWLWWIGAVPSVPTVDQIAAAVCDLMRNVLRKFGPRRRVCVGASGPSYSGRITAYTRNGRTWHIYFSPVTAELDSENGWRVVDSATFCGQHPGNRDEWITRG